MPVQSGSFPLGFWQLFVLAAIVAAAAAGAAYLVRKHRAADAGLPDAVFWDGFAGLAVLAPAVILTALVSPLAGLMLGLLATAAGAAGYRWAPVLLHRRQARRAAREAAAANKAAAVLHRAVLARWQRYELDPAHRIDFPALSDPRQAETAAFFKAMKAAERLRACNDPGYGPAVRRLDQALAEAERAAGAVRSVSI